MSEPKFGTRNYQVEYVEYLKDGACIIKFRDGKQALAKIISILDKRVLKESIMK